ncbi:DsbA family protein [Govanella unica]|uniref:DsbA family protein n=1 Tax=Govanella unica TaxID=2975056 RepID=A0A9X3TX22_9PROT|nr:DsbA family protein [Govania unica]MDA5193536.1 DsbA family protein [Govania unica]
MSFVMAAVASPLMAQQAPAFNPAQQKAIEAIVHNYILEHPEIIPQAIEALQTKMATSAIIRNKAALFNDPDSVSIGNPKGDVTVVEFFDYTCGYCKMMAPFFKRLVAADKGVRVIFKEWPVRGEIAEVASKAALASKAQGLQKYLAFHDALYAVPGQLSEASIFDAATLAKLDVARLKKDMQSAEVSAIIDRNHQLGQALELRGTPALIINNRLIPGALAYEELVKQVNSARAAAKKG